jgi:hypothetical protein
MPIRRANGEATSSFAALTSKGKGLLGAALQNSLGWPLVVDGAGELQRPNHHPVNRDCLSASLALRP